MTHQQWCARATAASILLLAMVGFAGGFTQDPGPNDSVTVEQGEQPRLRLTVAELSQQREAAIAVLAQKRALVQQERDRQAELRRTGVPVLDWKGSELQPMLHAAFLEMGHQEDAGMFAELAYEALNPIELDGGTLDWRNSNPYLVFRDAFIATGSEQLEAAALSVAVLNEMGYSPAPTEHRGEAAAMNMCEVYPVKILFCNGEQRTIQYKHINSLVWESVLDCPKPMGYACTGPDWYTMHSSGDCGGDFLPEGTCFWISQMGEETWINCVNFILQRNCITELDPATDCQEIQIVCGTDEDGRPEGCPCDPE